MWMALVTCVYSSSVILTLLSLITLLADDVTCEIYVSHVKLARWLIAFKKCEWMTHYASVALLNERKNIEIITVWHS